jgi:surface antigen
MYNLTLSQNGHFNKKKTNQKNHVSFMTHVFSQNEHPFGQCEHFSQI